MDPSEDRPEGKRAWGWMWGGPPEPLHQGVPCQALLQSAPPSKQEVIMKMNETHGLQRFEVQTKNPQRRIFVSASGMSYSLGLIV